MNSIQIYRRRFIPEETILLKDDLVVQADDEVVITTWNTLNPKTAFSHGSSCYFLEDGIKVSKIYRHDGSLLHWYCDIVAFDWNGERTVLTVTDLLADVIVYPDGHIKVVDLDELAEALDRGLITPAQLSQALKQLHKLLSLIYRDKFDRMQDRLNKLGL